MTSTAREKVLHILEIILRVPPLFLMDSVLQKGYTPEFVHQLYNSVEFNGNLNSTLAGDENINKKYQVMLTVSFDPQAILMVVLHMSAFILSLMVFLLSREHLILAYKWMFAVATVLLSYWSNVYYIDHSAIYPFEESRTFLLHFLLQLILAITFSMVHNQHQEEALLITLAFLLPSVTNGTIIFRPDVIRHLPTITTLATLTYLKICLICNLPRIVQAIFSTLRLTRIFVRYYGYHALLENEWTRLNIPHVLRVFWLVRVSEGIVFLVVEKLQPVELSSIKVIAKESLIGGCDTILAVMGMTSIVASVAHYFGYLVHHFLMADEDGEKSIGTVSAILFFILALQTGLTGLDPDKRYVRLYRNFCLLFTAMLHFVHNIVNPLLLSLSASRNRSVHRHVRVLTVCSFLILCPLWFLFYLWSNHSLSTWMLAVSAFTIEVIIKVVISLLLYFLFMFDAYRNNFWEELDDYVYYIRATGNTIEFIFGIFLFFNGAWILLFESGGAIRACMMCVHAYVNIWVQAKTGWRTFIKRRTAVYKINLLPEATAEQLSKFDDVCSICYQELTNARITKCNHYFHGVCLRKWLYVQDRCPLCHDTLYKMDSDTDEEKSTNENGGQAVNEVAAAVVASGSSSSQSQDGGESSVRRRREDARL